MDPKVDPNTEPNQQETETPNQPITPGSEVPETVNLADEAVPQPPKLKKSPKGLIIVLVIVLVLAAAGVVGWLFLGNNSDPAPQPEPAPQVNQTPTDDVPEAQNTETFTSDVYRITFGYPKTWTVTEEDDNGLLIQSQEFTYKNISGEDTNGNFRVYIRKPSTTANSEIIAKGVAITASQKLKYTNPAADQRAETNLTNFGKDANNNFSFTLITSNFDLQAGATLGPNFALEADAFLIGGGYSQSNLTPGLATVEVPTDNYSSTNAYKQALAIIASLQIN